MCKIIPIAIKLITRHTIFINLLLKILSKSNTKVCKTICVVNDNFNGIQIIKLKLRNSRGTIEYSFVY